MEGGVDMLEIKYNSLNLFKNGKPWLPIAGEMQYSRTRREEWRDSLYKMKAGGVDIVQSYVFWIHHEEIEGVYDFSGNKSLRDFLQEIKDAGMYMYLRIGPWPHGEARNGGFPDWLLEKGWELRSNDPNYLAKVHEYFSKLYEQSKGFMYSDGGPIIGIQIENEHGHCGGPTGEEGEEHIRTLKKMLDDIGFNAPIYSTTGWGDASTGGLVPFWGGYPEEPWCPSKDERPPNDNYLIKAGRNDINIGSDAGIKYDAAEIIDGFPYFTTEMGAGVQISKIRRPIISDKDAGALLLSKLASGVNLVGYYMYHGGTNPIGKLSFLNEYRGGSLKPGWTSDVPELSYDFQAPIREYGQIRQSHKEIKIVGLMLREFGDELALMETHIPKDEPNSAYDTEHLRYGTRHNGKSGYFFVNNYQRRRYMNVHTNVNISVSLDNEEIKIPTFDVKDGDYFFWPFNMKIGNALLKTAKATPLCILNNNDYIFYTDCEPEYNFDGEPDINKKIITISRKDALNSYKISTDKDYLFISDSLVMQTDKGIEIIGRKTPEFKVYPELSNTPIGFEKIGEEDGFVKYRKSIAHINNSVSFERIGEGEYEINITYGGFSENTYLNLEYGGNIARLYDGDKYIADNFYNGTDWDISLKRFGYPKSLRLKIEPLTKDEFVFIEKWPILKNGVADELYNACAETEYRFIINWQ